MYGYIIKQRKETPSFYIENALQQRIYNGYFYTAFAARNHVLYMLKNNPYALFLDDERFPGKDSISAVAVARSTEEALELIKKVGVPSYISFDHDLGENDTGFKFVKAFCAYLIKNNLALPVNFSYYIHSQNPVGAENIKSYMENYIRVHK